MRGLKTAKKLIAGLASVAVFAGLAGVNAVSTQGATAGSYTIWQPSTLPWPSQAIPDAQSVEVGVKFRVDVAGLVAGVRFFKGQGNSGTHIGNLWSSTGTLLASATFTGESDSGWQQVMFASPVPILPGVTYIASYFAPQGHYAGTTGYFQNSGFDNPPLHALKDGADGSDGVYSYSATSAFPNSTYASSNYWVDVVFSATVTTPPIVIAESPGGGALNVALNPEVTATFSEEVDPSTVSFNLVGSGGANVPALVTYELYGPTRAVTLQPYGNLDPSTIYTATISGAIDASGNTMTAPVAWSFTTTTQSAPPPDQAGQWSPDLKWPIVSLHSMLLRTGSVLQWDAESPGTQASVWNPDTNTFLTSQIGHPAWCSGQVQLADGRVLEFGGAEEIGGPLQRMASIYDPVSNSWIRVADMNVPRWYAAGVRLNDGRVVVISGSISQGVWADTPEVYDPAGNTWTLLNRVSTADMHEDLYPNAYLLPNGKVFVYGGSTGHTWILDVAAQTWTRGPDSPIFNGSSVMYGPGEFLVSGGTAAAAPSDAVQGIASVAQAATVDMTGPDPVWRIISPMNFARGYHNLLTLADGTVLAVGGTSTFSTGATDGTLPAEVWQPSAGTWTTLAPERDPRMNHSTAILLPSGQVLASGGGHDPGISDRDYFTAERFSPPYLLKAAQPQISSVPTSAGYGATISVGTPAPSAISSVVLMGLSAQTHKLDTSASYIPLNFSATPTGLDVSLPSSANIAPAGYYLLYVVDSNHVPSSAKIIQLIGTDLVPPVVGGMTPTDGAPSTSVSVAPTATFSKPVQPATISFTLKDASGNPVAGTLTYNSAMNTATFTPSSSLAFSTAYTATVQGATDLGGHPMAQPASWSFTTAPLTCPCSLWAASTVPSVPTANDPSSVEVGVKFQSGVNGFISGIRFYKGAGNTGTHIGNLWSSSGTLVASAAFTNETASGWQQVDFDGGVPVTAGTTYVASYYAPAGHYAFDSSYFAGSRVDNPPLHALANTESPNGVYSYGTGTRFPTSTHGATNYWVDVVFSPTATADTRPPSVTAAAPVDGSTGVSLTTAVSATFSEAVQPATITFLLRNAQGSPVPGYLSYDPSAYTATLRPTTALASQTTYITSVSASDLAGNAMATTATWSFTTAAQTCPCTIWGNDTVPMVTAANDGSSLELGVKFTSDTNGFIAGIRFYEGVGNNGTHIGNLWSSSGSLLATATFTNETASGWQQVIFASPVAVTAGTTYVASYFAPAGHYAYDGAYFATTGWSNAPLHTIANATSPNGVYIYSGSSAFPRNSFNGTNYWVDVVFTTG